MESKYLANHILNTCNELKSDITIKGSRFDNTRELTGARISLCFRDDYGITNFDELEAGIIEHYGEEKYRKKLESEKFHYEQIKYGLLHKVEELYYFHKSPLENRKNIIFSNDCISSVQYIKRADVTTLIVHMRSSDVEALLPIDLLYLGKALRRVNDHYTRESNRIPFSGYVGYEFMNVTIGSAHYYLSGGRE